MQITSNEQDGIIIALIEGRFTVGTEAPFKTEMDNIAARTKKIIFDCSKMEYIDSTGLGTIVRFYKDYTSKGGKLVLAALQTKPKLVFEITRAYKIFEIYETVEIALRSIK